MSEILGNMIIKTTLDGSGVESGLSGMRQQMRQANAAMKGQMSAFDRSEKSVEKYSTQIEGLGRKIRIQGGIVQDAQSKYDDAVKSKGKFSEEARKAETALNREKTSLNNMSRSMDDLKRDMQALETEQKAMESGWGKASRAAEDFGGKMKEVGGIMKDVGGALTAGVSAPLAALGGIGIKQALDVQKGQGMIQASLGATKKEAKDAGNVAEAVWKNAWGDNLEDATAGVITVKQVMRDLNDTDLQNVTEAAFMLRDTFGADVSQSVQSANTMMKNFGIDSTEAMDLITVGFQKGGDYSGELLDTLNEYSPQFASMGMDANGMMNLLVKGAQAGAFNLDKVGDSVKEFNIRAKDGSETTADGFAAIGLNADDMGAAIAEGGTKGEQAFQATLAGLAAMEDPVARNTAGVNLFGSQWEDLESEVITAMATTGDELGKVEGASKKAGDAVSDNLGTRFQGVLRTSLSALEPFGSFLVGIAEKAIPKIESLANSFENMSPKMQKTVGIAGLLAAAIGPVITVFAGVALVIGQVATAIAPVLARMALMGGRFKILRVAMLAFTGPVGLIIGVFAGLVAAGVAVYKNWDTISVKIAPLIGAFKRLWSNVKLITGIFKAVITEGKVMQNWISMLPAGVQGPVSAIAGFFLDMRKRIIGIFRQMAAFIKPILSDMLAFANQTIGKLKTFWNENGQQILQATKNVFGFLATLIGGALKGILAAVEFSLPLLKWIFETTWAAIKNIVSGAIKVITGIIQVFTGLFTGDFSKMWEGVKNIFLGAIQAVWGYVNLLFVGRIVKVIGGMVGILARSAGAIWSGIRSVFTKGVGWVLAIVTGFVGGVIGFFQDLYMKLVGNSIIPDTINQIVAWFRGLPGKVMAFIRSLRDSAVQVFTNLRDRVVSTVSNLWDRVSAIWQRMVLRTEYRFRYIQNFLVSLWRLVRDMVVETVTNLRDRMLRGFTRISDGTRSIFTSVRDFLVSLWTGARDRVTAIIERLWLNIRYRWLRVRNFTRELYRALRDFLVELWQNLRDRITSIASNLWIRIRTTFNNLRDGTKNIFANLRDWLRSTWSAIRDNTIGRAERIYNRVKSSFSNLYEKTKEIFRNIKSWISDTFDDLVSGAKKLPGRLGKAITNMAKEFTTPIKTMIESVAQTLEDGLNGVIAGANWIINMLGGSTDTVGEVDIMKYLPWYAKGTDGHPGGPAVLGDGRGSNAGRELFRTPDGQMGLSPAKDTIMNLPRGTQVASAKETKTMFGGNVPKYMFGIGGWFKDKFRSAKEAVSNVKDKVKGWGGQFKDRISGGLDKLKNVGANFYNEWSGGNLLSRALARMDVPGAATARHGEGNEHIDNLFDKNKLDGNSFWPGATVPGKTALGLLDKVVREGGSALMDKILPKFDTGDGRPDFGPAFTRNNGYGIFKPRDAMNIQAYNEQVDNERVWHRGIDFGAPKGTKFKAQAAGRVTHIIPDHGQVHVEKGPYEYIYAHSDTIAKKVGDWVEKGDVLGTVGNRSEVSERGTSFPHVHYGVKKNGKYVDPDELGGGYKEPDYSPEYYAQMGGAGGGIGGFSGVKFGSAFRRSSPFNPTRKHPIYGTIRPHRGADFAAPAGTPIPSQSAGTVTGKGYNSGLGNYVNVRDGGYTYRYGHMLRPASVTEGQKVRKGQTVGLVGSTGTSTGNHVHFEVRQGGASGRALNPETFTIPPGGGAPGGKGVQRWRPFVEKASREMKAGASSTDVDAVLRQIRRESGGNEKIIQSSAVRDINMRNGNPARGLLQYIPQTFAAYRMKGHGNIMSGYDQLMAFFNNRTWRRDNPGGKSGWGPRGGRRYEKGGLIDHEQIALMGEKGRKEMVIPLEQHRSRAISLWHEAGKSLGLFNQDSGGGVASGMAGAIKPAPNNDFAKLLAIVSRMIDKQERKAAEPKPVAKSESNETIKALKELVQSSNQQIELLKLLLMKELKVDLDGEPIAKSVNDYNALKDLGNVMG